MNQFDKKNLKKTPVIVQARRFDQQNHTQHKIHVKTTLKRWSQPHINGMGAHDELRNGLPFAFALT